MDVTFSFSSEVSISISSLDEANQVAVAMVSPEPFGEAASSESFHPLEPSISADQEDKEPIQVAVAKIPPPPSESEEPMEAIADPIEPINRAFFHFNDKLFFWVFKPAATGYKAIAPEGVRISVHNFFSNVTTPIRLVNCLLQAQVKCAGTETARFFLNTTMGIAGLFDPAKTEFNLEKQDKDFGQTLGVWGIGPAFYIDWPILGPSSLRDTVGYVGDLFLDPRTYLLNRYLIASISVWILDRVNETSLTLREYEDLKKAALDPYIALREAYHQYRENKIRGR
jgi:phospholipid-binding lipoprotein MlaA